MGKPNEKNNNEQVNQVKTSTSIVKWKNTVPITKTVMEFVAASALAGLAIALATQTVTLASLVALPQAHVIAIGIFVYFAVYYALSTYASYQKMSEIAKLEVKTEGANTLAKGAERVIGQAQAQVEVAKGHAEAAKLSEEAAKTTKTETVQAAEAAAENVVKGTAGTLFTDEVKRKAGEIAEGIVTGKAQEAVELARTTRSLVDQKTFEIALLAKADNSALEALNKLVNDPKDGLAAQNQAITVLNTTVSDKTKGLVTKVGGMETRLKTAEGTLKGSGKTLAAQITEQGNAITTLKDTVGEKGKSGMLQQIDTLDNRITANEVILKVPAGGQSLDQRIANNAAEIGTLKANVGKLETTVGKDDNEGLGKRVTTLETDVNHDATGLAKKLNKDDLPAEFANVLPGLLDDVKVVNLFTTGKLKVDTNTGIFMKI